MAGKTRRLGWWEVVTMVLAVNGVVFGFLFADSGNLGWAIATGFVPGAVLLIGLGMRASNRIVATVLILVASIASAVPFWTIYPVILALLVVVGGFVTDRLSLSRTRTAST